MTPEELMKPRWKVIGDYPNSPFFIGQIFTIPNFDKEFTRKYWAEEKDKFPNIFKRIEWWEERKIEEMPEYVKVTREDSVKDTGLYCKVYKWSVFDEKFPSVAGHFGAELEGYTPLYLARTELNFPGQIYGRLNAMNLQPATREEYEQYNKQKEVNNE